jgi:hypothetical protein
MPSFADKYETEATYKHSHHAAVLVEIEGESYWIPDSQIDDDSEIYLNCNMEAGTEATIVMSEWIAEEKGLI